MHLFYVFISSYPIICVHELACQMDDKSVKMHKSDQYSVFKFISKYKINICSFDNKFLFLSQNDCSQLHV